ncbi:ABC transporter substrate-binding protein [soil metagenome]
MFKNLLAIACVAASTAFMSAAATAETTKLVGAVEEDPAIINAVLTSAVSSYLLSAPVYQALTHIPKEGVIEPELAEKWEISPDGKTYTFHLRRDVKWHDGKPFTSADVKFSIENFTMKLHPWGKIAYKPVESVEAPDDYTVVYKLRQPSASLMQATDFAVAAILPKHLWEGTEFLKNPLNQKPVGTGPYKFVEYVRGQSIKYVRNPGFYGSKPYFDELIFRVLPDGATRVSALQNGEIDMMYWNALPQSDAARLATIPGITVKTTTNRGAAYLGIVNMKRAPLDDVRVRQAIMMALDRKFMRSSVDGGTTSLEMKGPVPPSSPLYNKALTDYEFNPAKANELLDAAGVVRGADGTRMTIDVLWPSFGLGAAKIAEIMSRNLAEVGIKTSLQPLDRPAMNQKAYVSGDFGITVDALAVGPDPDIGVERFYNSKNILKLPYVNNSSYSNPEVDKLFDEQRVQTDSALRKATYDKIQEQIWKDLPVLTFFAFTPNNAYRSKYVTGLFEETNGSFENFLRARPAGQPMAPSDASAGGFTVGPATYAGLGALVVVLVGGMAWRSSRRRSLSADA